MSNTAPLLLERYDDGLEEVLHYDPYTDQGSIEIRADVEAHLDHNKALQNDGTGGWSPTKEWRRVASIPTIVQLKWFAEEGIRAWDKADWPAVKRKLNDPDWRWLRTAPGRI